MVKIGMIINDRYEIIEKIGTGGMSDVYKALDSKLNRNVAVKVLKQEFGDNENFVSKFRVEAQAAAGLMHSNIVNVYDVGEEGDIHYIVMELVEGITLKKYIEKKARLTYKEAVSIAIQVSLGIEAAHGNHIIHRDIKPQNIIISRDGKVKVTDFGIAKAATSNTITSNVMGSVHYTSPEQARGGYSDEKSDIYSLGVSMFEMLTGRVPFNGETTVAIAIKHIQEDMPSPREYVPEIPQCVESIIMKCCEKSPDRRYQSMGELIADLKQALLTPENDFVVRDDPVMSGGTRVVADEEVSQVKMTLAPNQQTGPIKAHTQQYEQTYDNGEYYDNAQGEYYQEGYEQGYEGAENYDNSQYDENGELYDNGAYAYDENNYDTGLEDEEEYNPKAERITTIIAIAVGVVLIGIIIVVGFMFGKMSNKDGAGKPNDQQQTDVDDENQGGEEEEVKVTLPTLVGVNVDEIRNTLFGLGLKVNVSFDKSDSVEANLVISAANENGMVLTAGDEVLRGSTINIVASSGKGGIELPTVEGNQYETAKNALVKLGFTVNKIDKADDAVKEGYVISQNPAAGETVPEGSTITLEVSTGPEKKSVKVPQVVGLDEEEATLKIIEAGLTVGKISQVNNDSFAAGVVCAQSLEAGNFADEKAAIDITISLGSEVSTYKYEANITAPTTEEAPDYTSGMEVKVVLKTSDGKILLDSNVTSFPFTSNYYGLTASGGTITLSYDVTKHDTVDDSGNPIETTETKTVTRNVTFTKETK